MQHSLLACVELIASFSGPCPCSFALLTVCLTIATTSNGKLGNGVRTRLWSSLTQFHHLLLPSLGDDRNIQKVFVAGRDVMHSTSSAIKPVVPVFVLCMIQLLLTVL